MVSPRPSEPSALSRARRAHGDDAALAQARTEIEGLRLELAAERESAADARAAAAEAQIEVIRHAAEAEARELAERELAEASRHR